MSEYTARTCCSKVYNFNVSGKAGQMYGIVKSERRRKNKAARKARRANR